MTAKFYEDTLDSNKAYAALNKLREEFTFTECMWMFRNLCYGAWEDKLNDGTYSQNQQEQATQLKYGISVNVDLFTQLVVKHNEFNKEYLKQYEVAGPSLLKIEELNKEIESLKESIRNN